jgi:malate dehydrogenase (oxaloacetate-decarboxylating)
MDYFKRSLEIHEKTNGKIATEMKVSADTIEDLSIVYSPGVASTCMKIFEDRNEIYKYTIK